MKAKEAYFLISELSKIFDVVRLVDGEKTQVCRIDKDGNITREPLKCYEVWKKETRCINCISARVCPEHSRIEKYEFVDGEIYHVTSKLFHVEEESFALEIVSRTSDETLFEAYGKDTFMETIREMNRKMYADILTDTYNRRYYNEQVQVWRKVTAMAVVDVDSFKSVNDTYGHSTGDEALKAVAKVLRSHVRENDAVIRFGGDEFLMVYVGITKELFTSRLELAREAVSKIKLESCPKLKLTVSIGGAYSEERREDLFEIADKRLYEAKALKNKVIAGEV